MLGPALGAAMMEAVGMQAGCHHAGSLTRTPSALTEEAAHHVGDATGPPAEDRWMSLGWLHEFGPMHGGLKQAAQVLEHAGAPFP